MNKHTTVSALKLFLLIIFALTSSCAPLTVVPSPTLTPAPSQTPTATVKLTATRTFLSTVTPASTKQAITPTRSFASATPEYYSLVTQQPGSECLPPLTNFAFPAGVIRNLGNITPHPPTLPPSYWKMEVSLPDGFDYFWGTITILDNGEMWIKDSFTQRQGTSYFVYRKDKESYIYLEDSAKNKHSVPEKLLQTHDGTLWGFGTDYRYGLGPRKANPLISRFDESTGRFEYIESILHESDGYSGINDIQLDNLGFVWLLINQSYNYISHNTVVEEHDLPPGLYRFDPYTQKADYYLAMPENINYQRLMPVSDGNIWMLGYDKSSNETVLSRYFPETGELQPYPGTFSYFGNVDLPDLNVPVSSPLFLDSSDRLWIGTEGWLNHPASESPIWYRIIQPPIFIGGFVDGVGNFYRSIPFGMNESSDGMLWFWAGIGTVRLNPTIGEWCLFTTFSSPVVEDENHTLWMVADNKLFKYELGQ